MEMQCIYYVTGIEFSHIILKKFRSQKVDDNNDGGSGSGGGGSGSGTTIVITINLLMAVAVVSLMMICYISNISNLPHI